MSHKHNTEKPIPLTGQEKIELASRNKIKVLPSAYYELSLNNQTMDVSSSFTYIKRRYKNKQAIYSKQKQQYVTKKRIKEMSIVGKFKLMLKFKSPQYKVFKCENGFKQELTMEEV